MSKWKQISILFALLAILALPFILRPKNSDVHRVEETLVIITPHNEAIRHEFSRGFREWYRQKTGRTASIDWRVIGGTSEIARFLEGEYTASFQYYWTHELGKPWSTDVQAGFHNARLTADAPPEVREARAAFMASDVGCGIDLFFGGGPYDFIRQAQAGRIVDSGLLKKHPELFRDEVIPHMYAGEEYWDREGRWVGTVLSSYGVVANLDSLERLGVSMPQRWEDLKNPRLAGEIAVADPTKSGSIAKAFENVIQEQMQKRWNELRATAEGGDERALEARAVREGWLEGMRLMQIVGGNARYFTDTSQKPNIDVAQGTSAVGMTIDFYGRQQVEALRRRGESERLAYVTPRGGAVSSVDPIALMRGAKNREVALAFMEFVLSMEGQKLWNFRTGVPGGPERIALRRMPVRKDFYANAEYRALRSDPDDLPYENPNPLIYREAWTGKLFREMSFVIRVMCMDAHPELVRAWRAIVAAGMPPEALAAMQNLEAVDYDAAQGRIKQALTSKNKADEIRLAAELGEKFRQQYRRAEELARAGR